MRVEMETEVKGRKGEASARETETCLRNPAVRAKGQLHNQE